MSTSGTTRQWNIIHLIICDISVLVADDVGWWYSRGAKYVILIAPLHVALIEYECKGEQEEGMST